MKAKEYAEQFKANPTEETLKKIACYFVRDTGGIGMARGCKTSEAVWAVMDEQDNKWRAFARRVEGIRPDGYLSLMRAELPALMWLQYVDHRRSLGKPVDCETVCKQLS